MTQQDLSDALRSRGHFIPVASIGKIESGDRRVEVDDLVVLASALGVSPLALLLPDADTSSDRVLITGHHSEVAENLWGWAVGAYPLGELDGSVEDMEEEIRYFRFKSNPWWFSVDASIERFDASNDLHRKIVGRKRRWDQDDVEPTDG